VTRQGNGRVIRVLFVCTGNSARSQIAEALLAALGGGRFLAASAGSHPADRVSRGAIAVLAEHGISWTDRVPKPIDDVEHERWDVVITVCDHAREHCPIFPGQPLVAHWGMPDPATVDDGAARRAAFADTYEVLRRRIERLIAIDFADGGGVDLARRVQAIGEDSSAAAISPPPPWVRRLADLTRFLSHDFLGGPRVIRLGWVINLQKLGTLPFVALLMLWYDNTSVGAWVYLALHGTYGICWVLKDRLYPDTAWLERVTLGGAAMTFLLVLGPYWVAPWLLISGVLGPAHPAPTPPLLAAAIALHTGGLALMLGADAQKYFTLRLRRGLIADGLFSRIRHPNYLGEMMIYSAYALLVRHWIPWAILAWVWGVVFYPRMRMIDASLARYPGFPEWSRRAGLLLPRRSRH